MKPQCKGNLRQTVKVAKWWGLKSVQVAATCAWGAAIDAAGLTIKLKPKDGSLSFGAPIRGAAIDSSDYYLDVPPEWSRLLSITQQCPACALGGEGTVLIAHLNDHHSWTREQIADWVETIEAAQPVPVEAEAAHA